MTTFHGYPQIDGADPVRPWWVERIPGNSGGLGLELVRADGTAIPGGQRGAPREGRGADAAAADRAAPMAAPAPLVGQVWVMANGDHRGVVCVEGGVPYLAGAKGPIAAPVWPPPGAVLTSGPGAPWGA